MIQVEKARELRKVWAARGNPPCGHPRTDKVYYLGADMGDDACTTCGKTAQRGTLRAPRESN